MVSPLVGARDGKLRARRMALSVVDTSKSAQDCSSINWKNVQFEQFEHDEKYHREISRLPIQGRLRHMTLHFAKYAGRLMDDHAESDFRRIATDAMIIAISTANTLNIDLAREAIDADLSDISRDAFVKRLAISAGRMSSACERLDHLEDFPFRQVLTGETKDILAACLALFKTEGWHPVDDMAARLLPVKAKSIFHGML